MVNLLPTVLVGGPPHAGKSVLFYHLTQALRARHIPHHAIRACPDGEGNWFQEGAQEMVSELRVKQTGPWPTSFVERVTQDLEYRCLPFLVDMGGQPKDTQTELFRLCTHSILLLRRDRPDATQRWQHLLDQHDILPLASLYSEQAGDSVIMVGTRPLQGTLTRLERHQPMQKNDPLFDELVERIASLFCSYDLSNRKKTYFERAPTELILDLEAALKTFTTTSSDWQPSMLHPYLKSIPANVPLSVYGPGPNWLYAALAAHAGQQPFHLFDPRLPFGWVQPVPVILGKDQSPEMRIEIAGNTEVSILKITFPADRIEYFQPDALALPAIAADKGIIIDGRTPYWLLTALMRLYKEAGVAWIAPFYARSNQAVVAYSRVKQYQPGDAVPKPLLGL